MSPLGTTPWGGAAWGSGGRGALIGPVTLKLGGSEYTPYLLVDTLQLTDTLNARSTLQCRLRDRATGFHLPVGTPVELWHGPVKLFGGSLDQVTEARRTATSETFHDLQAVDFSQLADRELVAEEFTSQTVRAIAASLVATYLADDGVTLDPAMVDGPTVDYLQFNYKTVAACFDDLDTLSGFAWTIDADRILRFFDRSTNLAPFAIDSTVAEKPYLANSLTVLATRQQYRNAQYVRAGTDITDPLTERFKGDGATRTFTVGFPLALAPTAFTVNGSPKTVGVRQVDTGKDFYWQENSNQLTQDQSGTLLTGSDTLAVTYQGYFPIIVESQETAEIAARAAIEGGSGLYEALEDMPDITRSSLAMNYADGFLRKYGQIPLTLQFDTFQDGLASGQLLTVNLPEHGILNQQYLISEVDVADVKKTLLKYTVTALSGERLGTWVDFFRGLAVEGRKPARTSEVLMLLRRFTDPAGLDETFTTEPDAAACAQVEVDAVGFCEVC